MSKGSAFAVEFKELGCIGVDGYDHITGFELYASIWVGGDIVQ